MAIRSLAIQLGLIFQFLIPICNTAQAQENVLLSQVEIYYRCYLRMTRSVPAPNDVYLSQVKAGSLTGVNACMNILNKANFQSNGIIANTNDVVAKNVLETMHLLHKDWFNSSLFFINRDTEYLLRDPEEPALYFTKALFANVRADSVLVYDKPIRAVRNRGTSTLTNFQARRFANYQADSPADNFAPLLMLGYGRDARLNVTTGQSNLNAIEVPDDIVVDFGQLVGIEDQKPLIIPEILAPRLGSGTGSEVEKAEFNATVAAAKNVDYYQYFGGGVIGSIPYIMQNTNLGTNNFANGVAVINRRYTSRIFEDLLCHQLPNLLPEDVEAHVIPDSTFTFQQSKSCMQCHSTIDPLAMANSNLLQIQTYTGGQAAKAPGFRGTGIIKLPVVTGSTKFPLRPQPVKLYFRSLAQTEGSTLVNVNITGDRPHQRIGMELAKHPDFYTCLAKRYYEYFTGVKVPLASDPEQSELDKQHRAFILAEGKKLMSSSNQSVKTLIRNIFLSETFQMRNFKSQGLIISEESK